MGKKSILKILALSSIVLLFGSTCIAQERREGRQPPSRPLGFFEPLRFISSDTSTCRVDINFKIPKKFFVFVRSTNEANEFTARTEITAEIITPNKLSVAREILRREIHQKGGAEELSDQEGSVQGNFTFFVAPGEYRVLFEVDDLESERKMAFPTPELSLKKITPASPGFSDILTVERTEWRRDSTLKVFPVNLGGDVEFGKDFSVFFQSAGLGDSTDVVRFTVYKVDERMKRTDLFSDSAVSSPKLADTEPTQNEEDSLLSYSLKKIPGVAGIKTYLFPLRADTLKPGKYGLEVKGERNSVTRKLFEVRWMGMPRTLANVEVANEALELLMTEKEFEEFMSRSPEEKGRQFEEFWKKRDPTPSTAYNEAMEEFYRRCDYALENFATLSRPNGIKSDRGKVYILYGPPTKTERSLGPDAPPREIWYYENLGKRFLFVDESKSGNYKLLSSEKL
jgi:GWxTD domain-containing protein